MWDPGGDGGSAQKGSLRHTCVNQGPRPPGCHIASPFGHFLKVGGGRLTRGIWGTWAWCQAEGPSLLSSLRSWSGMPSWGWVHSPYPCPRPVLGLGQGSTESGGHGCWQGGCWSQAGCSGRAALGGRCVSCSTRARTRPCPVNSSSRSHWWTGTGSGGHTGRSSRAKSVGLHLPPSAHTNPSSPATAQRRGSGHRGAGARGHLCTWRRLGRPRLLPPAAGQQRAPSDRAASSRPVQRSGPNAPGQDPPLWLLSARVRQCS